MTETHGQEIKLDRGTAHPDVHTPVGPNATVGRIISNVFAMGVGQISTWSLSLVYFVVLGRYLGPFHFGQLALARSVVAVFWLGATLGMELLIARAIAREPERTGVLTSAAIIARTSLAVPVLVALYAYTKLAHYSPDVCTAAYVFGLAEILWSSQKVFLATFQGREQMSLNAIWTFCRNFLRLVLTFAVIRYGGGIVAFAWTDVPIAVLLLGLMLHWMRRFGKLTWRVSRNDMYEVVVGGLAFWANEVFFTIYLYIDSVILAGLAGVQAVGIYTPATQLFSVAMFLTGILGPATLPQLARLGIERGEEFKKVARKVFSLFIVAGVLFTIGLATFAGPLIIGIFGPSYGASVPVLVMLSLTILPMFLNSQFSQTLAASDRQWWWAAALAGACILNPLLNVVCVPLAQHLWHNAAEGAALAWLITELAEVVYGIILLRDVVVSMFLLRVLAACAVAGVAQAALVWAVGTIWLPLGEAFGVAAFGLVAVALGAIPRSDIELVVGTIVRRVRRQSIPVPVAGAEL